MSRHKNITYLVGRITGGSLSDEQLATLAREVFMLPGDAPSTSPRLIGVHHGYAAQQARAQLDTLPTVDRCDEGHCTGHPTPTKDGGDNE